MKYRSILLTIGAIATGALFALHDTHAINGALQNQVVPGKPRAVSSVTTASNPAPARKASKQAVRDVNSTVLRAESTQAASVRVLQDRVTELERSFAQMLRSLSAGHTRLPTAQEEPDISPEQWVEKETQAVQAYEAAQRQEFAQQARNMAWETALEAQINSIPPAANGISLATSAALCKQTQCQVKLAFTDVINELQLTEWMASWKIDSATIKKQSADGLSVELLVHGAEGASS